MSGRTPDPERAGRWRRPLLAPRSARRIRLGGLPIAAALLFSGCIDDNIRTVRHRTVAGGDAGRAETALRAYGCTGCHVIPGIRGADSHVGPPLNGWAERRFIAGRLPNETDNLITFLVNPQVVKPGSAMPATGIGIDEARDVAAYLYTLR